MAFCYRHGDDDNCDDDGDCDQSETETSYVSKCKQAAGENGETQFFLIVLTWTTFVPNLKTFPPVDFGRKFVMEIKTHLLPFSKTKQI